ncbi:kinase-like protein [Polyplosphaeria fusca]|uniref:non-specific serine/threonine protein kinase n=1 Tax=Polyplosphaeria fusca TaxID=682080 RepID=A0A9P4QRX2_9PLEO|nr:kinase-like protein [Polyplosphaeria fusca]
MHSEAFLFPTRILRRYIVYDVRFEFTVAFYLIKLSGIYSEGAVLNNRWRIKKCLNASSDEISKVLLDEDLQNAEMTRIMKLVSKERNSQTIQREVASLKNRTHPHIIELFDWHFAETGLELDYLAMSYCEYGTLEQLIKRGTQQNQRFSEPFLWHAFEQLASAVRYLHFGTKDVPDPNLEALYHRNITCTDIFLTQSHSPDNSFSTLKLGDCSSSCYHSETNIPGFNPKEALPKEDPDYVPPEGLVASVAADVYQIGLVMACLLARDTHTGFRLRDKYKGYRKRFRMIKGYSKLLKGTVLVCLRTESKQRPSSLALLDELRERKAQRKGEGDEEEMFVAV